jgi:hypothetical protein
MCGGPPSRRGQAGVNPPEARIAEAPQSVVVSNISLCPNSATMRQARCSKVNTLASDANLTHTHDYLFSSVRTVHSCPLSLGRSILLLPA